MYRNTVDFLVTGEYALFSEPITRVSGEKTTLHIPTYEALKGIISSVYWKPTFVWYIDEVRIMNPIQTQTKGIKTLKNGKKYDLSYYTYLTQVAYQVRAHFEWNLNREELVKDRNENKIIYMACSINKPLFHNRIFYFFATSFMSLYFMF